MIVQGPRILLIEDEPGMVLTIRDRLRGEGYQVTVCENGLGGYETALKGGFDLILLDVMLPDKDGLAVCRDLRAKGVDTPVIMVTAKSQIIDRVLGLKIGADDYLVKPFDFMELTARMEALLRRRGGSSAPKRDRRSVTGSAPSPFWCRRRSSSTGRRRWT